MKKLIVAVLFCFLMLGMMTSLSATVNAGTLPTAGVQYNACIEKDLTCVLNGTACCGPYTCKGKFPNTTCQ